MNYTEIFKILNRIVAPIILGGIDSKRSFKLLVIYLFIMQRREIGQICLERKKLDNVPGPGSMKPLSLVASEPWV